MDNILVVKLNIPFRTKDLNDIREFILSQKESGLILLPPYCEAFVVPEGTEVRIMDTSGEFVKGIKGTERI